MGKVTPFNSIRQLVYHTNTGCSEAVRIDPIDRHTGTGHKVECLCCARLNRTKQKRKTRKALEV
ncbi:hypothetical protein [Spirosoma agri]|uniref:Uncharacterized protein n=1 Tax=Spirosoma agri TaxID=1987381 RepID=A0A6M0IFC3_9BACT|nr:hypothetical protein [Spirosoma agri]NEU66969.1 hypothetical protein [Spirosoma agri]